jgi:hypothetical protein
VCAVVLNVSPAEDVVRYDSRAPGPSMRASSCGRPGSGVDGEDEDRDADEGGSGGGMIRMQRVLG